MARVQGQIAFGYAAMRDGRAARRWAARCIRHDWRQPRAYLALLVSMRVLSPDALLAAFESLRISPDLIFCDAQGYAHPRRFGLACHLGVLLDTPTIGVAKSLLIGECQEPAQRAGSASALVDAGTGEKIGAAVRMANGVKPVYVSQGHRISLARAIEFTLAVKSGFRIPRPTREADHFVNQLCRQHKSLAAAG